MNRLENQHIEFLRICANAPNQIHPKPPNVSAEDLNQMVQESLLIPYFKPAGTMYAISKNGSSVIKSMNTPSVEMRHLARQYVLSKGVPEEYVDGVIDQHGVENILKSQAEEMNNGRQKEVNIPTNEFGAREIKFRG